MVSNRLSFSTLYLFVLDSEPRVVDRYSYLRLQSLYTSQLSVDIAWRNGY
jgi:hypothetical protein